MKKIFTLLALSAIVIASCTKHDPINGGVTPSKAAQAGFESQVPPQTNDIWDVEWDFEGTYWEVSYETGTRPHGIEYTMYFDLDGNWLATKTEVLLTAVPQAIMDALTASEYGQYPLDDREADYVEKADGTIFYKFDIEIGGRDAEIEITLDGKISFKWDY